MTVGHTYLLGGSGTCVRQRTGGGRQDDKHMRRNSRRFVNTLPSDTI